MYEYVVSCFWHYESWKFENFILNVAFISFNTYLLKQRAIPLNTRRATNGSKVVKTFLVNTETMGSPEPVL